MARSLESLLTNRLLSAALSVLRTLEVVILHAIWAHTIGSTKNYRDLEACMQGSLRLSVLKSLIQQ